MILLIHSDSMKHHKTQHPGFRSCERTRDNDQNMICYLCLVYDLFDSLKLLVWISLVV